MAKKNEDVQETLLTNQVISSARENYKRAATLLIARSVGRARVRLKINCDSCEPGQKISLKISVFHPISFK